MKSLLFFISLLLITTYGNGQNIEIKDDIAYIDETSYVKIEKIADNKFFILDLNNEKLLKIELVEAYNRLDKETHKLPRVYSYRNKRKSKYEIDIQSEIELIEFVYSKKLVPLSHRSN